MNMQHSIDTNAAVAVATGPDPRECDRIVVDLVRELGANDAFMQAGYFAQLFLRHAAVVGFAFVVVELIQG